ncbi:p110 9L [African swine fever virus]|uniref:p110 9L n=1 Tax=African swine fever virus TaxID=10497 RepID=A0A894KSW1_ASF|nr:p110 9L [African swine fever virus]
MFIYMSFYLYVPFYIFGLCTIHVMLLLYPVLGFVHTPVMPPGNCTIINIFILRIITVVTIHFIFAHSIFTGPAEVTVFCIRAPELVFPFRRPTHLHRIICGKRYVHYVVRHQNSYMYIHSKKDMQSCTGLHSHSCILFANVHHVGNGTYHTKTSMFYILNVNVSILPYLHYLIKPIILCGICTAHVVYASYLTVCILPTFFTIPGNPTYLYVFIFFVMWMFFKNLIFANPVSTIPAEVTRSCIRAPILKLFFWRSPGHWYLSCPCKGLALYVRLHVRQYQKEYNHFHVCNVYVATYTL